MIDKLLFDTTSAATDGDTHNVGAYVRSGKSSALITHHALFKAPASPFVFVDGDVTVGSDSVAETAHGFRTGDLVQLTSSGVLPAGLALATDYYIIRVDANNIKFALTQFNAEWNIAVDITAAAGGGNHTVTGQTQDVRALDVFAALADGEGNKLTSTGGSLNVNMTNSLAVDIDGIYSGGNTNPDNAGLIAHVRAASPGDVEQTFRSTGAGPAADDVAATNVHALDVNSFGMMFDGSNWDRMRGTSAAGLLVNVSNSTLAVTQSGTWTVGLSEDHNYGVVGANTLRTAAQIGNATGAADFDAGLSGAQTLRVTIATDDLVAVSDTALANSTLKSRAESGATALTSKDIISAPLASRKYVWIYNNDNQKMFIGGAGVVVTDGFPISPGSYMELRAGAAVDVEFVSTKTAHLIRTLEIS
jgi:hypothetical protein